MNTTPSIISDLLAVAQRLKLDRVVSASELREMAIVLEGDVLEQLTESYLKASSHKGLDDLNSWLTANCTSNDARAVHNVVSLYSHLGRQSVQPFRSFSIRTHVVRPVADWRNVPEQYQFLADLSHALETSPLPTDEEMRVELINAMSDLQRTQLANAAQGLDAADVRAIKQWCSKMGALEHREAALPFKCLTFLDHFIQSQSNPPGDR